MSIQQSLNNILSSVARGVGAIKIKSAIEEQTKTIKDYTEENRMIEEAEAKEEYMNKEAQSEGFKDAYQKHEIQTEAQNAAAALERKGQKPMFYTHTEPTKQAFGDPDPADRYRLSGAIPEGGGKDSAIAKVNADALNNYIRRADTLNSQKENMKQRKEIFNYGGVE